MVLVVRISQKPITWDLSSNVNKQRSGRNIKKEITWNASIMSQYWKFLQEEDRTCSLLTSAVSVFQD